MPHMSTNRESAPANIALRDDVTPGDLNAVRHMVEATGFFRSDEIDVAVELVAERIARGAPSGYEFLFAEHQGAVVGYACYGPIACTLGSFDLYWIVVDPAWQKLGVGRMLVREVEQRIKDAGGRQIYIETSGREQYAPTRHFYASCGYAIAASLTDFYDQGDDKVIWRKVCRPT